jgi:hypothetical protein
VGSGPSAQPGGPDPDIVVLAAQSFDQRGQATEIPRLSQPERIVKLLFF